jgi:PAS domain S-box-containing protein
MITNNIHFLFKLLIIFILLLIHNISVTGESSTKKNIQTVDDDKILIDLATKVYANQPDKSLQYAITALNISRQKKDIITEVRALKIIGDIYSRNNFYKKALPYYHLAAKLYSSHNEISINILYQNLGDIYFKLNINDSAFLFYNKALKGFQETGSKLGQGTCFLKIGNTYWISNNFDKSLEYYLNALNIFEDIKYSNGLARVYLNIGLVYYVTRYYNKSLEYYNKSKLILEKTYDQDILADLYFRFGELYEKKNQMSESLKYFDLSLSLYDSLKNNLYKANVYRSKSNILHILGKNDEAIKLAHLALQIGENYDNQWFNTLTHNSISTIYIDKGNFKEAIFHLNKASELANNLKSWPLLKDNYLNYSKYYSARGEYKLALDYFQKFQSMNDSIQNKEKNEHIAQLQVKFESDRSKNEIKLKEKEIQKNLVKLQKQKLQLYLFSIGVFIILLLSIALYRQYKILEIKGKKIERINAELDERVKERTSALRLTQFSVDQASDPIFWLSKKGNYVFANKAACDKLEHSKEELIHSSILDIIPNFSIHDWQELWKIIKKEKSLLIESLHMKKSGSIFPVEIVLNYIDHEKNEFAFAFVRDISERKQKEENLKKAKEKAEEADKLKSAFLANMSHEIRTPMNAIIGFSDLLVSEEYSLEEKKEFGNLIKNSGNSLLKLIDDIIDISIMEAGHLKLNISPQFVNTHLNEIILFFQEEKTVRGKQSVEIILNIPPNSDKISINTDPVRFRQVINNLIGNALKFTENGRIEIGYRYENDSVLCFFVKDSGIGIRPEKLDKIFERFNKLEDDRRIYAGTGLGLTISKKIVEELGGIMYVESEFEKGSTFSFTLPYYNSTLSLNSHLIEIENNIENKYLWKDKSILIVEDVDSNFLYLETLLIKTQAKLSWVKTGMEAVQYCKKNIPDIILMDIQLPELSGYEATRQIRQIHPFIPIIAQTAYAFSGEKEKILEAGCNDYITKPIKPIILFEAIKKLMN